MFFYTEKEETQRTQRRKIDFFCEAEKMDTLPLVAAMGGGGLCFLTKRKMRILIFSPREKISVFSVSPLSLCKISDV